MVTLVSEQADARSESYTHAYSWTVPAPSAARVAEVAEPLARGVRMPPALIVPNSYLRCHVTEHHAHACMHACRHWKPAMAHMWVLPTGPFRCAAASLLNMRRSEASASRHVPSFAQHVMPGNHLLRTKTWQHMHACM